jgi:putative DNA-invertase from lambdoid prophage Rac
VERGVSGSVPLGDRPHCKALLATLKAGDIVITPKLDCMFRSALDALGVLTTLKDHSISLHMIDLCGDVTGNGISKLVFTILSAVAEAERDRIRERVSTVEADQADQKVRARYLGGKVLYGYALTPDDGGVTFDSIPAQKAVIERIRTMRNARTPLRAIQAAIASEGTALSLEAISRICREGR